MQNSNIYTKRNVADVMTLVKRNESLNVFCELAPVQSCFAFEQCYLVEYWGTKTNNRNSFRNSLPCVWSNKIKKKKQFIGSYPTKP